MKIIGLALLPCLLLGTLHAKDPASYSLRVEVKDLRNSNGILQVNLYNKEDSIPDQKLEKTFKIAKARIVNQSSFVVFKGLPPGRYAVHILHDENSNGKIDKGFVLPVEGVGLSNFESIGLANRPNFSKASFDLKGDKTISVKVIYF
ncbi:MAG TPA: DUF2141 domain-containing protein [Turneriella sp.]|nr:DUF2141 domain-containing protein [Turneriella sp.]HNE18944.1 DUF2141 domain-containing protein [Turneriella sp.]HNJ65353.1 DUF2141 domain-containing protein [Turneriella sp.]HNL11208.1 DUF2141 domain-containing protein [Turneriella sp.]HNL55469.1 DUF2141 domain-containing protein [Turneriella sp.]